MHLITLALCIDLIINVSRGNVCMRNIMKIIIVMLNIFGLSVESLDAQQQRPDPLHALQQEERHARESLENEILGECSVCLGDNTWKNIMISPCGHHFDEACIDQWMNRSETCPLCRASLPPRSPTYGIKNGSMHEAARLGYINLMKRMLATGIKINGQDAFGKTPLHHAVTKNNVDIVRLLLAQGANVHAIDAAGNTPSSLALSDNVSNEISTLIEAAVHVRHHQYFSYLVKMGIVVNMIYVVYMMIYFFNNSYSTPCHIRQNLFKSALMWSQAITTINAGLIIGLAKLWNIYEV